MVKLINTHIQKKRRRREPSSSPSSSSSSSLSAVVWDPKEQQKKMIKDIRLFACSACVCGRGPALWEENSFSCRGFCVVYVRQSNKLFAEEETRRSP